MSFKRTRVRGWWNFPEEPKDHEAIPDGLGLGVREERDPDGQLFIWLRAHSNPVARWAYSPYIVLGKYAEPQHDGSLFYVGDWTKRGINADTTKHPHLLMAIAKIQEIINAYNDENS